MKKTYLLFLLAFSLVLCISCMKENKEPSTPEAKENLENEFEEMPYTRFGDIELISILEGETFNYAPESQEVFGTSFDCNGTKITVNAPAFTGLKTQNAYTYKELFAFENSESVVSVLAKDDSGKGTVRYILFDKDGNVKNFDYDSHTNISDRVSISKYPDDIKIIQTGDLGNYKQYLATADGEILSEEFDEIGFFNDGIALARRGNKIGFISLDGKTLLEPSVEIDDVRYTPDYYRGYQVKHITDDAFIVPINGELAIITLERN